MMCTACGICDILFHYCRHPPHFPPNSPIKQFSFVRRQSWRLSYSGSKMETREKRSQRAYIFLIISFCFFFDINNIYSPPSSHSFRVCVFFLSVLFRIAFFYSLKTIHICQEIRQNKTNRPSKLIRALRKTFGFNYREKKNFERRKNKIFVKKPKSAQVLVEKSK